MTALRTSVWSLYPPALYPPMKNLLREWNTPDGFLERASLLALETLDPEIVKMIESGMDSIRYSPINDPDLGFGDFHLVGDLRLRKRHLVFASFYRGWNKLNGNQLSIPVSLQSANSDRAPDGMGDARASSAHRDDYRWVNSTAQLRYLAMLSDRATTSLRIRSSEYTLSHEYSALGQTAVQVFPMPDGTFHAVRLIGDVVPTDNGNRVREVALEGSLDVVPTTGHLLQLGADVTRTSYRFNIEDVTYSNPITDSSAAWRFSGFLLDEIALSSRFSLRPGSRITLLSERGTVYLEPRVEARYLALRGPVGPWSVWAATGVYRQFVNQFNVSSVSPSVLLPSIRFWLPIDESVRPPKAYHVAAGMRMEPADRWALRVETYYKHQPHLLFIDYVSLWDQRYANSTAAHPGQRAFLHDGRGYGYGGALAIERETRRTRYDARYEFGVARRTRTLLASDAGGYIATGVAPERGDGYEPVPWSEPHRIELGFNWQASSRITTTARWRGVWGRTWAFRQSYYDYLGTDPWLDSPRFGDFNIRMPERHRLPSFQQLDLSLAYSMEWGVTVCQLRVDLLNVLNRVNTADWTLHRQKPSGAEPEYRVVARPMLPRTPSITLRVRW